MTPAAYARHKEQARQRQASLSLQGRDIGALPPVKNPERKAACLASLRIFLDTYFPETFFLGWSEDHLRVIARIETAVRSGGLFALAMPRGSGKTSMCERAAIWAILSGRCEYVALVGADAKHAASMLRTVKTELLANDLLFDDFPEVCHPIRRLENIPHRAAGQLCNGVQTFIGWAGDRIVLPTIPGAATSGAILHVAGLLAAVRGLKHTTGDARTLRPSLAVIDDPQTDRSAKSPTQCESRERILSGAILGLAGPGRTIAGLMTLTVIRSGDLADRMLDRDKHPEWTGERCRMIYEMPKNDALWDEYAEIRRAGQRAGDNGTAGNDFYVARREAMDEGAKVAWPERRTKHELSALQHAMNLRIDRGLAAFAAEYQNDPGMAETPDAGLPTPAAVAARTNGRPRGQVPLQAARITAFIDVHKEILFWCAVAWEVERFTGAVIDYGTWPMQPVGLFTLATATRTLSRAYHGAGEDGAIQAGLTDLVKDLLARDWPRDGGGEAKIDRLHVDMGYKADIVAAVKRTAGATMWLSKGLGIRAGGRPISMYQKRPGWTLGADWYIPSTAGTRDHPHCAVDVNPWKTFIMARIMTAPGDPGALTIFGKQADDHENFALHVAASETYVQTQGYGRQVREWRLRPDRPDNHWLDCLVGCAAAASMTGVRLAGAPEFQQHARKSYTREDLKRK